MGLRNGAERRWCDSGCPHCGQVAAPVFSRVMSGALRLLAIPPDKLPLLESRHDQSGDSA